MTSTFILKVYKYKNIYGHYWESFTERAWTIYFSIAESKECLLQKELLLNQKMTFPFSLKKKKHQSFMSSWDSCIAGYVLKTLNRLRGLIMYLKILAQLGAHVTFFFPFKLLPQLISQVDSQRGRCVSSHIVCNIDNLERYRPCDTNMSMSVSVRQFCNGFSKTR